MFIILVLAGAGSAWGKGFPFRFAVTNFFTAAS
jgi:hypothetical protein